MHALHEACMSTLWENKANIEGAGRSQLHIFSTSDSNQNVLHLTQPFLKQSFWFPYQENEIGKQILIFHTIGATPPWSNIFHFHAAFGINFGATLPHFEGGTFPLGNSGSATTSSCGQ